MLETGSCSCPGLVGATLGAGVGRYQGLHGLIIDALLSVRLVVADGRAIEVSEDSYSDLFWGIRGAGTNFGVITSATYKIHRLTNKGRILNADFVFTGNMTTAYFETLKSFGTFPAELVPTQGFFWDASSNSVSCQYLSCLFVPSVSNNLIDSANSQLDLHWPRGEGPRVDDSYIRHWSRSGER